MQLPSFLARAAKAICRIDAERSPSAGGAAPSSPEVPASSDPSSDPFSDGFCNAPHALPVGPLSQQQMIGFRTRQRPGHPMGSGNTSQEEGIYVLQAMIKSGLSDI